jgi:hypothetical protein
MSIVENGFLKELGCAVDGADDVGGREDPPIAALAISSREALKS